MTTLLLLLITALVFWLLGWKECEKYNRMKSKKDDFELSNYFKDRIIEMQSEIVTLKALNKN